MKNFLALFLSALPIFAANSADLSDAARLLEYRCKLDGADYPDPDYVETESPFAAHYENNKYEITDFLSISSGTVLILGPGPANDLPLDFFLTRFTKIIMIDGYIEPMEIWKNSLDQAGKDKVTLIKWDLTGGFFGLFCENKSAIKNALKIAYGRYVGTNELVFSEYIQLLKVPGLILNHAKHKPDVIVSSLVASQLGKMFEPDVRAFIYKVLEDSFAKDDEKYDLFAKEISNINSDLVQSVYLKALVETGASKVYFSDTLGIRSDLSDDEEDDYEMGYSSELIDNGILNHFIDLMKKSYHDYRVDFAWDFRERIVPVSWIKFIKYQETFEPDNT